MLLSTLDFNRNPFEDHGQRSFQTASLPPTSPAKGGGDFNVGTDRLTGGIEHLNNGGNNSTSTEIGLKSPPPSGEVKIQSGPAADTFHSHRQISDEKKPKEQIQSQDSQNGVKPEVIFGEKPEEQREMYQALQNAFEWDPRKDPAHNMESNVAKIQLRQLWGRGILTDTQSEDGHSTLYHLNQILSKPRGIGYDNKHILKETIDLLERPEGGTQFFGDPSKKAGEWMVWQHNQELASLSAEASLPYQAITMEDIKPEITATCGATSVQYCMAATQPSEFCRHIEGLTSPMNAFFKTVSLSHVSPDKPDDGLAILQEKGIPCFETQQPGTVIVKVENPLGGVLRAVDSQQYFSREHAKRNAIESAYQSALTRLVSPFYDPATDSPLFKDESMGHFPGVTDEEKTLMETIIRGQGGIGLVTYQVAWGKVNPKPHEENKVYLYGYSRHFNDIQNDILASLKKGKPVIVGITNTEPGGEIYTGHVITIKDAVFDKETQEWIFKIKDSGATTLQDIRASELIPQIHHVGLELEKVKQIKAEVRKNPSLILPTAEESKHYDILDISPLPPEKLPEKPEIATNKSLLFSSIRKALK